MAGTVRPSPAQRRPARRRLTGLLVLLLAVGATAEAWLRVADPARPPVLVPGDPGRLRISAHYPKFAPLDVRERPERPRILYVGASTESGFPFGVGASPAAWVERILRWRGADVEVLCLACPGLDARETLPLLREGLALSPAAVVVGLGHNEYQRTALLDLPWWLESVLVRRVAFVTGLWRPVNQPPPPGWAFDHEEIVGGLRDALAAMQSLADDAGVPLLVTMPVSNLSDCPPVLGDGPPGDEAPDAAWDRGRALRAAGHVADARRALEQARDSDGWPYRATSRVREAIPLAARHVVRVDLAFEAASRDGLPGDELFVDNCHPLPAGMRVLALAVSDALEDLRVVPPTGRLGEAPPLDELTHATGIDADRLAQADADVARAYVLFALHTQRHGRMAEMARARLGQADARFFAPGEAETMWAVLALLHGDVDEARERLRVVQRDTPAMIETLGRGVARFASLRAAFARHGLDLAELSAPGP
jgi:hypothetical protein